MIIIDLVMMKQNLNIRAASPKCLIYYFIITLVIAYSICFSASAFLLNI